MRQARSVTEVARRFAEYINRVSYHGERFVLMRGKRAVAELRPLPGGRRLGELPSLLASLPRLDEAEAEAFAEEWSAARAELDAGGGEDRWAS